jgi:hypothetical protein
LIASSHRSLRFLSLARSLHSLEYTESFVFTVFRSNKAPALREDPYWRIGSILATIREEKKPAYFLPEWPPSCLYPNSIQSSHPSSHFYIELTEGTELTENETENETILWCWIWDRETLWHLICHIPQENVLGRIPWNLPSFPLSNCP